MSKVERSWFPMIVISLSNVMLYITTFGVNVLISPIVNDLQSTVSTLQAVIVSASLIGGALMVTAGRLGDKYGEKKIFSIGVAIYVLGMIIVILSPNTLIFIVGWAIIWPLGMVMVVPTSIALIMNYYHGSQRVLAFGVYGAVLSAVSALAPVIVGLIADNVNWRVSLSLSPIFGIITLLMAYSLPETEGDKTISIDVRSVILSTLGFGFFLVSTTLAGQYGWLWEKRPLVIAGNTITFGELSVVPIIYGVSLIAIFLFIVRCVRLKKQGKVPLLDLTLFKNISFSLGLFIGGFFFLVNAGFLFVVSVYLQAGVQMDSLSTALTTLPFTAILAILSFLTPPLGKKIAPKWILIFGAICMLLGIWLSGQLARMDMTPLVLLVPMIITGIGGGLIMAQYTGVTMMNVKPENSGAASGLTETMKEILGQGFAVAFAGSILFGSVYTSMADSYANIEGKTLSDRTRQEEVVKLEDIFNSISVPEEEKYVSELPEKIRLAYSDIVSRAANTGLKNALFSINIFLFLSLVLMFFLPNRILR
ncbi:MFS transporter [Microbulbifer variabilis]|uniref:MFS transporter n=1 Tax=Microbulbifer variabilis TaxID=266805 RepID=A0ABY4V863_9GAMM|nr:MFS transporter [Microbulbifer variabilis]USD19596.1 MFS transporter [Microbulbifer variabilis]